MEFLRFRNEVGEFSAHVSARESLLAEGCTLVDDEPGHPEPDKLFTAKDGSPRPKSASADAKE